MKLRLLAAALFFALPTAAHAQCTGVFASGRMCANSTASDGIAAQTTATAWLDRVFGSSTPQTIYRGSGGWVALGLPLSPTLGGTGVANNTANTLTWSGNFPATFTLTGSTGVTFPTSGTLATTTTPAASIVVGTTAVTSGTTMGVLFNNAGVLGNTAAGTAGVALVGNGGSAPAFGQILAAGVTTIAPFNQPNSYPVNVTSGNFIGWLNEDNQFGNAYSQYPLGSVSTNSITVGRAGSTINDTVGNFTLQFASSGLSGSPITIGPVTGASRDAIASSLCTAVNANSTLHGTGGKPIFCQPLGDGVGTFNLQYDAAFTATGATPLTTTVIAGNITLHAEVDFLDYIIFQLGRDAPTNANSALYAFDFTGRDSTNVGLNTHYGIMGVDAVVSTAGATRGAFRFSTAHNSSFLGRLYLGEGMYLYGASNAVPSGGDKGQGTINLPNDTGLYMNGLNRIFRDSAGTAFTIDGSTDKLVLSATGVGINVSPTNTTFTSALGTFISGTQVPTTGSGWSLQGSTTPVLAARNYGTSAWLASSYQALSFDFRPSGSTTTGLTISANSIVPNAANATTLGTTALPFSNIATVNILLDGSSSGTLTVKAAAAAGTNTLTFPAGTTDFSATGGSNQVVKQTSAGGAFTVAQLAIGDMSNIANNTIVGNQSGGSGPPLALTVPQVAAMFTKPTVCAGFSGGTCPTSGTNATYTTPANVTYIRVEMIGGGGGGAGSGTTPSAATAGGDTCWKTSGTACTTPLYQASGGALGTTAGATAAGGGVAGSATCNDSQTGGTGGAATGVLPSVGGAGGISRYGGGGPISGVSSSGVAGSANSGSGGSGGGSSGTANSGGGGGAGGWCMFYITSPAATYVYTVGASGTAGGAGTGGVVGGAGAAGKIQVTEFYN